MIDTAETKVLKKTDTGDSKTTAVDLPTQNMPVQKLVQYVTKTVPISSIRDLENFPGFVSASIYGQPVLVQQENDPDVYYLADGKSLVEEAKQNNHSEIACFVNSIAAKDQGQLVMQATDVRLLRADRDVSYMETVMNIGACYEQLKNSEIDFIEYGHGGDRTRDASKGTNIISFMADRWGKSPKTINTGLNHIKNLSPETMHHLAKLRAPKDFFEKIRTAKTALVSKLRKNGDDQEEKIKSEISKKVCGWFDEFKTHDGNIPSLPKPKKPLETEDESTGGDNYSEENGGDNAEHDQTGSEPVGMENDVDQCSEESEGATKNGAESKDTATYCTTILTGICKHNCVLVTTKAHLECVREICEKYFPFKNQILFRVMLKSADPAFLKLVEPGAPEYEERIESVRLAHASGFNTTAGCTPMIDTTVFELVDAVVPYVQYIWLDVIKSGTLNGRLKINNVPADISRKLTAKNAEQDKRFIRLLDKKYCGHQKVLYKSNLNKLTDTLNHERR